MKSSEGPVHTLSAGVLVKTLADLPHDALMTFGVDGRIVTWSAGAERLTGYSSGEALRREWSWLFTPEQISQRLPSRLLKRVRGEGVVTDEGWREHRSGSRFWAEAVIKPLHDEHGQLIGYLQVLHDLTAHRATEQLQQVHARMLDHIMNATPDGVIAATAEGRILYVNAAATEFFGCSAEEAFGQPLERFIPARPENAAATAAAVATASATAPGTALRKQWIPLVGVRADGSELPLEAVISTAVLDGHGLLIFHLMRPGERQEFRTEVENWQARFEAVIRASRNLLYDWDAHTDEVTWAGDAESVTGYTVEELGNLKAWVELLHPDDCGPFRQEIERVLATGEGFKKEYRIIRKDGQVAILEDVGYFVKLNDGQSHHMVGFVKDVTERKQLEEQYTLAQKMEAVGRLAGGIAHDFNNLLTVILGHAELAMLQLGRDRDAIQFAEPIRAAALRAAGLTRQLLAFARRQLSEPKVIDLNSQLDDLTVLLHSLLGESIAFVLAKQPGLWPVRIDPTQFEQVVINLAVNARDALPGGGRFMLETGNRSLDESFCSTHPPLQPGEYVCLAASDNGCGMSAAVQQRVFEPFFTTKPHGKGTGLGLPTCQGIIQQAGGNIVVRSQTGVGTTFEIFLPRAQAEVDAPAATDCESVPHGYGIVLVVEDDAVVRQLAVSSLRAYGYTVLEADSAPAALGLLEEQDWSMDLLVTDIIMPHMSGAELARRVRERLPALRVLFVSGYADSELNVLGQRGSTDSFLVKPFSPAVLVRRVWELLFQHGAGSSSEHGGG